MKIRTTQGVEADVDPAEIKRHAEMMGMKMPGNEKAHYADLTQEVIKRAQNELREMTGDEPEDLKEMFEFAVKHKLFGNRTETHLMCNFLKLFYGLMQQMTHE
jgi:hypothetical protein